MYIKKFLISFIVFVLSAAGLVAQSIGVEAPSVVGLSEQFNVTFVMEEQPSGYTPWTPGDAFQLVWGPQQGSSTSISIVNGKHSKTSRYTYTYILVPRSKGSFTLPAFHAVIDGKDVSSKAATIEVADDGSDAPQTQPSSGGSQGGHAGGNVSSSSDPSAASSSSDMILSFSLSRNSVVVGEPLTATLKLFTRANISGFEDAKFPKFNDFWSQEIEAPQNIQFHRESLGGVMYDAAVLRRWTLVPQKAGSVKIDPAELVCLTQQRISSGGNSIFDGFFDDYQTIRKRLTSKPVTLQVQALPAGAPASFTGAVGEYKIMASLSKDSLKMHDAATLTVKITGKGNVALVAAPKIKFAPDTEVYDTKTSDNTEKSAGGTSGSKVFEYPFIPRSHGDFTVGPIDFTYYSTSAGKYVTLSAPALCYHVERGAEDESLSMSSSSLMKQGAKGVQNLSEDIHYISTQLPALGSRDSILAGSTLYWTLIALISLVCAALCIALYKYRASRSDVVLVRVKGASRMAKRRLATAKTLLDRNQKGPFYDELYRALLGYASDKLSISSAELSKENIASGFAAVSVAGEFIAEFNEILEKAEFARYAPVGEGDEMKAMYDRAANIISTMEANIRKKTGASGGSHLIALVFAICAFTLAMEIPVSAQDTAPADSLWDRGVKAYSAGEYASAAEWFTAIENKGLAAADLYVNIADSYYKNGDIAPAILYYERALRLDPSNDDARYNIGIARQRLRDRFETVPEFFLVTWSRDLCYSLTSNAWAVLSIVFFLLLAACISLFFLSRHPLRRKAGFFSAIAAVVLFALCLLNALWQKNEILASDKAIVFSSVCSAKNAPSGSGDLFVIHEGTKVGVKDKVGEWTNIVLPDGREGWVKSSDITII